MNDDFGIFIILWLSGFALGIFILVKITRWLFRINEIVELLKEIKRKIRLSENNSDLPKLSEQNSIEYDLRTVPDESFGQCNGCNHKFPQEQMKRIHVCEKSYLLCMRCYEIITKHREKLHQKK